MTLVNDIAAEVNREEARLLERGHHHRGRLGIVPRALRPDPERTFVASDRMAQIDVNRSFRIATMGEAVGLILVIVCAPGDRKIRSKQQPLVKSGRSGGPRTDGGLSNDR
jgi:hypothetical protein